MEVGGELVAVERGAHQNDLEIQALLQDPLDHDEQEVGLHTSFVHLKHKISVNYKNIKRGKHYRVYNSVQFQAVIAHTCHGHTL